MGSYGENKPGRHGHPAWYQLPPRSPTGCWWWFVAGAIWSRCEDGDFIYGQS